ncbi:aluminum-activated malate transporter 12-like [Diospyros lotus]|uniref:aluminum-activated malate transporter 12-like n=1 Tax=Diospyros lotus TaxID=55363 RepID=UPI0022558804|nr:aluminum-activated malate transporter 12-like [Diospyros lotus]
MMMSSTVVTIPMEEDEKNGRKQRPRMARQQKDGVYRKVIHSAKVGIALVLVSLLYLLDPLYQYFGDNAMWAVMTVVVIFEFYAGATLGKGLNRGAGTILGGGLGCLAAILADEVGGVGNAIVAGICVFVFGAAATYCRLAPSIKRRYDYGSMIFILTFNLVIVSGLRTDKIIEIALDRLSTIGVGFVICIATSLLIFPVWSSDELHNSTAAKFERLACCVEECLEEYFRVIDEKGIHPSESVSSCQSVLYSKPNDESLANFARWEPWHGKFGLSHPWDKYLQIGDVLRELAATITTLKGCIQSPLQPSSSSRQCIKEPCEAVGSLLAGILGELGETVMKMERPRPKELIASKLQSVKLELSLVASAPSKLEASENSTEGLGLASFMFLLLEIAEKVEVLAKEVEELGELPGFPTY